MNSLILHGAMGKLASALLIFVLASPALAGTKDGGGGRSVVCRNPDGSVKSASLLDLYEATTLYGLKPAVALGSIRDVLKDIGTTVETATQGSHSANISASSLDITYRKFNFLPLGTAIQLVDDSHDVLVPNGCAVEQLALYKEENLILVNSDIWSKLPMIDQAALVLHENVYRLMRDEGATDSIEARWIVGQMISGIPLVRWIDSLPTKHVFCHTEDGSTDVYVTLNCTTSFCSTAFDFERFNNSGVYSRTRVSTGSRDFYDYITGAVAFPIDAMSAVSTSASIESTIHYVNTQAATLRITPDAAVGEFVRVGVNLRATLNGSPSDEKSLGSLICEFEAKGNSGYEPLKP